MGKQNSQVIRASEIGQYAYCARAWWLDRVLGYRSSHVEVMEAGTAGHEQHGRTVMSYHRLRQAGVFFLTLALVSTAVLIWLLNQ